MNLINHITKMNINCGGIEFFVWKELTEEFRGYYLYVKVKQSSKLVYRGEIMLGGIDKPGDKFTSASEQIRNMFANNGKHLITFEGMDDECSVIRLNLHIIKNAMPYTIEVECKAVDFDTQLLVKVLRDNLALSARLAKLESRDANA